MQSYAGASFYKEFKKSFLTHALSTANYDLERCQGKHKKLY